MNWRTTQLKRQYVPYVKRRVVESAGCVVTASPAAAPVVWKIDGFGRDLLGLLDIATVDTAHRWIEAVQSRRGSVPGRWKLGDGIRKLTDVAKGVGHLDPPLVGELLDTCHHRNSATHDHRAGSQQIRRMQFFHPVRRWQQIGEGAFLDVLLRFAVPNPGSEGEHIQIIVDIRKGPGHIAKAIRC